MSIINALTDKELVMFDMYRDRYAGDSNCDYIPSEELLEMAWAPQKERYLYPLLNNSLIYHEQITYELDEERILEGIYKFFSNVNSATAQFINEFKVWRDDNAATLKETGSEWYINFLCSPPVLAQNVYNGLTFYVNCPNDKIVKVQQGCRPVKTLLKILNMWGGLPHQDAFREEVSRVLTQKKLQGTLSLSIHPLDYATMSDNDNDWTSCMSWQEEGCYRAGTVEMMNSEAVVVAYLSNRDMEIPGGYTWNSKMWRQLFVVSPKGIFGVKAYPYQNEHLTDAALHSLARLAEKNLGWKFDENVVAFQHNDWFDYAHVPGGESHSYCLTFRTNAMYNDFGTITHRGIIASTWDGNTYEDGSPKKFVFNYSGPRQCMSCGSTDACFNDTVDLLCEDCDGTVCCSHCGERLYDDGYEVDGDILCEYCYENQATYDILDEMAHYTDNMVRVYVLPHDFTKEEMDALSTGNDWINRYQFPRFDTHYTNVSEIWNDYFSVAPVKFNDGLEIAYYVLEKDVADIYEINSVIRSNKSYHGHAELPEPIIILN